MNPNLINQLQLNPQINKNSEKYKNMRVKSKIKVKRKLNSEKRYVASTYLGQIMLWFQDKDCIKSIAQSFFYHMIIIT
jgi:hypothetical protein